MTSAQRKYFCCLVHCKNYFNLNCDDQVKFGDQRYQGVSRGGIVETETHF